MGLRREGAYCVWVFGWEGQVGASKTVEPLTVLQRVKKPLPPPPASTRLLQPPPPSPSCLAVATPISLSPFPSHLFLVVRAQARVLAFGV